MCVEIGKGGRRIGRGDIEEEGEGEKEVKKKRRGTERRRRGKKGGEEDGEEETDDAGALQLRS